MAPRDERGRHGQAGDDVAGGAATGDQRVRGRDALITSRAAGRPLVARDVQQQTAAAMITSSDEPPNDTNGNGTPVIGNAPTTAPMFTKAWKRIQVVTPAASNMP